MTRLKRVNIGNKKILYLL